MKQFLSGASMAVLASGLAIAAQIPNRPPDVEAGPDQVAEEGATIQLAGTVFDPDSTPTLRWSQRSGPPGLFVTPSEARTAFVLPETDRPTVIVLRLTADDGQNRPVSDEIRIEVRNTRGAIETPSPQGIPEDTDRRREAARRDREGPDQGAQRRYDGSGNNRDNPDWGASFEPLQRLAPADYGNGVYSLAGAGRPSARQISNDVSAQSDDEWIPNRFGATDFVWQWGQFIDHDLDLTDGAEESANIAVPSGDAYFDPAGTGAVVIPFSRALFDPETGTDPSNPREQENEITSWIDGSMIYGSSRDRADALREGADSPFLATSSGDLLPFNVDGLTNANGFVTDPALLFLAGDVRANEQLGLTVMHTLFVREHNRIARELQAERPGADAETLFQDARRRVIAQIQAITFNEWLPVLIGEDAIAPYERYDPTVNPTIYNAFSAAAFRLGHSMLNSHLLRLDARGDETEDGHIALRDAFFSGYQVLQDAEDLDPILRGFANQAHQAIDPKLIDDVRNFLFGAPGAGGFDLASLNIQRGRDHGLPSYTAMREALGLRPVRRFSDISRDRETVDALQRAYASVDEIDLWVGGLSEDPIPGSQLGPVFQAIIAKQFEDLRDGDRFWYERDLPRDLVREINETRLSDVIRRNTGIGAELQRDVFRLP